MRLREELIRDLLELGGLQEAGRGAIVFMHGIADFDHEAEWACDDLGGLDRLALAAGDDLRGARKPARSRYRLGPRASNRAQAPLRHRNVGIDLHLRVGEIADDVGGHLIDAVVVVVACMERSGMRGRFPGLRFAPSGLPV